MSVASGSNRAPIEFWFDFASGYAYFAALEIEALAERHGRTVLWRPFTLGAAFKITGAQGLSRTPLKREYAWQDWQRLARLKGVPFKLPDQHPKVGLAAIRAFYGLERKDAPAAARLAKSIIFGYSAKVSTPTTPKPSPLLLKRLALFPISSLPALLIQRSKPPRAGRVRQRSAEVYSDRRGFSSMGSHFGATIGLPCRAVAGERSVVRTAIMLCVDAIWRRVGKPTAARQNSTPPDAHKEEQ